MYHLNNKIFISRDNLCSVFFFLGHLLGYKGEHWAMLKKKKKNNYKKKATHSLDGELVKHLALNPQKHIFSALVLSKRDFYCAAKKQVALKIHLSKYGLHEYLCILVFIGSHHDNLDDIRLQDLSFNSKHSSAHEAFIKVKKMS